MPVLTITDSDVLKTARLDPADSTNIADAAFVVGAEQGAIEAGIQVAALADSNLTPLLTRNVMKLLAAEVLDMQSREDGASGTFQGAGVTIGKPLDHAVRLRDEARLALAPYLRTGIAEPVYVGPDTALSDLGVQSDLYGRTEAELRSSDD